jgi:hypothetical protein
MGFRLDPFGSELGKMTGVCKDGNKILSYA